GLSEATKHTHDEARARMIAMHQDFWYPRVSVVIPCWNQAEYLPTAIRSVLAQTVQEFEIIVVDDGSPDDVVGVLEQFADDPRIKLIRQSNMGLSGARNSGIVASVGQFILTLDADDEVEPTFLDECISALDANPDVSYIYTDIAHTQLLPDGNRGVMKVSEMPDYDFDLLLKQNLHINTILQRRAVFEAVGGYNPNMRFGYEDWDYAIAAGERGFCGARIPKPLFRYLFKTADQGSMIMQIRAHRNEALAQLHTNHPIVYSGGRPMGCCGRHTLARAPVRGSSVPVQSVPKLGELPLVDIEYVGEEIVPFSVRGSVTGTTYKNISPAVRVRQFDPRDAAALVSGDPRFRYASDAVGVGANAG
ncbi:MAG: glycosyltransferase, partial [Methanoregula sp.]|nr:glycosyltransferase [Methanoregula sp.]